MIQKLPHGVNFAIHNSQTSEKKIVHHNRLIPFTPSRNKDSGVIEFHTVRNQKDNDAKEFGEHKTLDTLRSSSSEEEANSIHSDMSDELASDLEASSSDNATPPRQYPRRFR